MSDLRIAKRRRYTAQQSCKSDDVSLIVSKGWNTNKTNTVINENHCTINNKFS